MASEADIEYTTDEHPDTGRQQDCVIATCCESGESKTAWGHSTASVRRALAMLSEDCDCGETYHEASGGEDA